MPLTRIWERYFTKELLKTALFFILSFYGLYVLIDYANHSANFHRHQVQFQYQEVALYYASEFSERLGVLLPFALLIATIRTLCGLNTHNELVALLSSGVSLSKIMRPFIFVALVCTGLLYLNGEYLLPKAQRALQEIDSKRASLKKKAQQPLAAQSIVMSDGSRFIFHHFDEIQQQFLDVYWIRNASDLYRIKTLQIGTAVPEGKFIDHFVRNKHDELVTERSFESRSFPEMHFNQQTLFETVESLDELPLAELWDKLPAPSKELTEREAKLLSLFYQKLFLPWLCLLAVIGPAPFCLQITRHLPIFFIYAGSIFGFMTTYLIMNAALLLGERQTLSPFVAVGWPFCLIFLYLGGRFVRKMN